MWQSTMGYVVVASVNKTILLGNLTKDPEVRYLPSGEPVANVTIATNSRYKNKQGEMVEESEFHRVTFFGRLAEVAGEYLKKGRPVYVEGRIKTNKYTDKNGVERYSTDVIASEMQLLGDRTEGDRQERPAAPPQRQAAPSHPAPREKSGFDDMDEDPIPF